MEQLRNILFTNQTSNSKILYLMIFTFLFINSLWSQKVQWSQNTFELQPDEIEKLEGCLGFSIKKIYVDLNTNDTLRLRRGYTPRYFSEIRLEHNAQTNDYTVEILFNRNSALNLKNFQSCFTNFYKTINQTGKHIIEIEFESQIAFANRLAEFENGLYVTIDNHMEQFLEPDNWYKEYDKEAEYLRNAEKGLKSKITKEYNDSYSQILSKYKTQLKQDTLSENKIAYKNYENIIHNFNSDLDSLLAGIINSNQ